MRANRNREKLIPLDDLQRKVRELGFTDFSFDKVDRQLIDSDKPRSIKDRCIDYLTDNYQHRLIRNGDGYVVIPEAGWAYPAGVIRNKKFIIAVDWYNKKGTIRTRDISRYNTIIKRLKKDLANYHTNKKKIDAEYANSREKVTSLDFWEKYLGIESIA